MRTGFAFFVVASTAWGVLSNVAGNLVFDVLTRSGVELTDGTKVRLPMPSMPDDANAEKERGIIQSVAGGRAFAQFVRNSRVAPFTLDMKSQANTAGQRTGQTVNLWFVAHGDLELIEDERLFDELFELGDSKSEGRQLTEAELAARQIDTLPSSPEREERFSVLDAVLLEKVQLNGVTQMVVTRFDHCLLAAFRIDPRFTEDKVFANRWRSITRDQQGKSVLGPANVYEGFGGYLKATKLKSVQGAVFVELHLVFNEPGEWFEGRNLLRSKLPLLMQENVRRFRSKLVNLGK